MANDIGKYSDIGECIFKYVPESKKIDPKHRKINNKFFY